MVFGLDRFIALLDAKLLEKDQKIKFLENRLESVEIELNSVHEALDDAYHENTHLKEDLLDIEKILAEMAPPIK